MQSIVLTVLRFILVSGLLEINLQTTMNDGLGYFNHASFVLFQKGVQEFG